MRDHRQITERNLIIGGFALVVFVGGGLIWYFYGGGAFSLAMVCFGGAIALVIFVYLILRLLEWISQIGDR